MFYCNGSVFWNQFFFFFAYFLFAESLIYDYSQQIIYYQLLGLSYRAWKYFGGSMSAAN